MIDPTPNESSIFPPASSRRRARTPESQGLLRELSSFIRWLVTGKRAGSGGPLAA